MDSVGERLKWAIRKYGPRPRGRPGATGSIRGFHELVKEEVPSGKGASYQMLHRYLPTDSGKPADTVPPETFLRAAANVLSDEDRRVRWEWIATGKGEPTEEGEESQLRKQEVTLGASTKQALRFKGEVLDGLAPMPEEGGPLSMDVMESWALSVNAPGVPVWVAPLSEVRERTGMEGTQIGRVLRATLDAAGIRPGHLNESLTDYILAMVPVLLGLAPAAARRAVRVRMEESQSEED